MATGENDKRWTETGVLSGFKPRISRFYERVDQRSGGWLSKIRQMIGRFTEMHGSETAASMAYYALFSLFPLALFLVALLGYVIDNEAAYRYTVLVIRNIFPFADEILNQNLRDIIATRGTVGVLAIITTIWLASGYFNIMTTAINRAWPMVKLRSYVHHRLVGLAMMFALLLLLALSLVSTALVNLLPMLLLDEAGDAVQQSQIWKTLLGIVPAVFTFLMFVSLYRWAPNKIVDWKAVLPGALLVALAWELGKLIFALYLRSGMGNYQFIYGSLGALIALMVWIYFSNLITLFGAYLVAMLDQRIEQKQNKPVPEPKAEVSPPKGIHG